MNFSKLPLLTSVSAKYTMFYSKLELVKSVNNVIYGRCEPEFEDLEFIFRQTDSEDSRYYVRDS